MRIALTAFIVASAAAFTVAILPLAAPVSATSCDDIKVIFARGSGQELDESEYRSFKSALEAELKNTNLSYGFYELGTTAQAGHQYPAVALNFLNTISAVVSAGTAFEYGNSVSEGSAELVAYIENVSAACPTTKFILAGYSQGAQVISMSTSKIDSDKIIYAATFGDPKLYLPEGQGINPPACSGQNLSPYRAYAPNCKTYQGSLGAKNPYQESGWDGKIGLYCNDKDLICGAGLNLDSSGDGDADFLERIRKNAMFAHTSYASASTIKRAVVDASNKITLAFAGQSQTKNTPSNASKSTATSIIIFSEPSPMFSSSFIKYANSQINTFIDRGDDIILSTYSIHGIDSNLYLGMMTLDNPNFNFCNQLGACAKYIYFAEHANIENSEDYLVAELEYLLEKYSWPNSENSKNIYIFTENVDSASSTAKQLILEAKNYNINVDFVSPELKTTAKSNHGSAKNTAFAASTPANISNISYSLVANMVELKYQLNAAAVLISMNDAPLGLTSQNSIKITDANFGDKFTLIPIDRNGNFGESTEIIIQPFSYGNIRVPLVGDVIPSVPNCGKL